MKFSILIKGVVALFFPLLFSACASIPEETVMLSQKLGGDLHTLHESHQRMVKFYFDGVREDVNDFIDDTYAPFVIHYVLEKELNAYEAGDTASIYAVIKKAGTSPTKLTSENALTSMQDFLNAAKKQIESKRSELLDPLRAQEREILDSINHSYQNVIYANSTITGHLQSVRKVKDAQSNALELLGFENAERKTIDSLVKLSEVVSDAVDKAEDIDVKSDKASESLEDIIEKIKTVTKNKN